jgi:pimeloyl-ACP methyl ester carboxylesterase
MCNHFQLILIDLQNHGKSDHRDIPETFEQDAKDVIAVLENIGIEKASFLALAMVLLLRLKLQNYFLRK